MESTERKLSLKKYLLAFILTILVFSGGVVIGIVLENARLNDSKQTALNEKVSLQSLQMQQKYMDIGITDCKALNKILEANLNELAKKMAMVIDYEKKSFFNEDEFQLQLREYFLTEMQYLFTAQEIDKKCKKDNIKIVYFYDESKFDTQGTILGYLKNIFGDKILIFSFNSAFSEEPMINILLTSYKIKEFPALVVDEKVMQGHQEVDVLLKVICEKFKMMGNVPEECKV